MIKKYTKPMTHFFIDSVSGRALPCRIYTLPTLDFPDGVPLKKILEHLSLDCHRYVDKACVKNWEHILHRLQESIPYPPFVPFGEPTPQQLEVEINGVRGKEFIESGKRRLINCIGTFREYEYFFRWFKGRYFGKSRINSGLFLSFTV